MELNRDIAVNIMDLLYNEYFKETSAVAASDKEGALQNFVSFAKKFLQDRPPVGVAYPEVGIGLRLMSGETVTFQSQPESQPRVDTSAYVTWPKAAPGVRGMLPSQEVVVFGGK